MANIRDVKIKKYMIFKLACFASLVNCFAPIGHHDELGRTSPAFSPVSVLPQATLLETSLENLFELKLIPPHRWPQSSKLPIPVNFAIPMLDHRMAMPLILHCLQIRPGVALVSSSQLMVTDYFIFRQFLPFRCTDMVLRMHKRIPQKSSVAHDGNILLRRNSLPFTAVYLGIVNLQCRLVSVESRRVWKVLFKYFTDHHCGSKYLAESVPVLFIVAIAPLKRDLRQWEILYSSESDRLISGMDNKEAARCE